jgi:hypothetical protein
MQSAASKAMAEELERVVGNAVQGELTFAPHRR